MKNHNNPPSFNGSIVLLLVVINVVIAKYAFLHNTGWYWMLVVSLPLLLMAVVRKRQPSLKAKRGALAG